MQMVHRVLRSATKLDIISPRYVQSGNGALGIPRGCFRPFHHMHKTSFILPSGPIRSSKMLTTSSHNNQHQHQLTNHSPMNCSHTYTHTQVPFNSPSAFVTEDLGMAQGHDWVTQSSSPLLQKLRRGFNALHLLFQSPGEDANSSKMTKSETLQEGQPRRSLAERMPSGAWDSHMHVFDLENYDLIPNAIYRPNSYSLEQALEFEATVGIKNIVLVQPSIYGNDNGCLIDALKELGPKRGRGVVAFDPSNTTVEQLQQWHDLGVRGARFNVQSSGRTLEPDELRKLLNSYADAVRPFGWVMQAYVPMHLIELLEPIIPTLNVRFCIDHIGHPNLKEFKGTNPYDLPGFSSLIKLLEGGHTYVKLSAPYRTSQRDDNKDIEPFAKEVIRVKGKSHVVFATDWPHTRYEGLDIQPWMEDVFEWCGDDDVLVERLFRGNAEDLWDVKRE